MLRRTDHEHERSFGFIPKFDFWFNTKSPATMTFSGNQLRAARALLGLDQEALAEKVGVSDNTIRNMEACGPEPIGGFASTREKVREALERLGIEFSNGNAPGVRLRRVDTPSKSARPLRKPGK
jgi:transcriptional regulator with XRE-family HTH domain